MQFDEFMQAVQERGRFADRDRALSVVRATLQTLAERIVGGEATDLASQLPQEIAAFVHETAGGTRDAEIFDAPEFCRRVADREGGGISAELAEQHVRAVMETCGRP